MSTQEHYFEKKALEITIKSEFLILIISLTVMALTRKHI